MVDVAKRAGRVELIEFAGQVGLGSKQVIFKRVNQVAGQSGHESSRVAGLVELTHIFQTSFFIFIFYLNRCNLSIVYEFLNCD